MSPLASTPDALSLDAWSPHAYLKAANAIAGQDPRLEETMKRAADPNTGMPKRVSDDGIDVVEPVARNMVGTGTRSAYGYDRGIGR